MIESEEEMESPEEQEETRQQEESLEQESEEGEFSLEISLSIESVDLRGEQDVSVAYELCCGDAWAVAQGQTRGSTFVCSTADPETDRIFLSQKVEISLQSKSKRMSPAFVFTVLGFDFLCRETVLGYAVFRVPLNQEKTQEEIPVFKVLDANSVLGFVSRVLGRSVRVIDPHRTLFLEENRSLLQTEELGTLGLVCKTKIKNQSH